MRFRILHHAGDYYSIQIKGWFWWKSTRGTFPSRQIAEREMNKRKEALIPPKVIYTDPIEKDS